MSINFQIHVHELVKVMIHVTIFGRNAKSHIFQNITVKLSQVTQFQQKTKQVPTITVNISFSFNMFKILFAVSVHLLISPGNFLLLNTAFFFGNILHKSSYSITTEQELKVRI